MAAPTFVNLTFQTGGAVQLTMLWPASHQVGDVALLVIESSATIPDLATDAGFVEIPDSPQVITGLNARIFWCRATSTSQASPVTGTAANHIAATLMTFRGCIASGNPWDVTSNSTKTTTSTATSITGDTSTVAECLVVYAAVRDSDFGANQYSNPADATLASITERLDNGTNLGNGGGIGMWSGVKTAAGAYGPMTADLANTATEVYWSIALRPPDAGSTVTPAVVATTTTVPTPTILAASNVTPAVVATVASVPTPNILAAANVSPAVVDTVVTVPTPTVLAGAVAEPAVVTATMTVPTPTVAAGDTVVTPAAVTTTTTVPTPTIQAGAVVTPATVTTVTTVPTPTVAGEGIGNPATVAVVSTVPTPLIEAGAVVTPGVVAATTTVPTPIVAAQATVTPATVETVVTIPTPNVHGGSVVFPATVGTFVTVPTPTISGGVPASIQLPATATISDADNSGTIRDRSPVGVLSSADRTGTIRR